MHSSPVTVTKFINGVAQTPTIRARGTIAPKGRTAYLMRFGEMA